MKEIALETMEKMGDFHNDLILLIDASELALPEVLIVLRKHMHKVEEFFSITVESIRRKAEVTNGDNMGKTGV